MNQEKLKELERIRKANGGILTTEKVIAAARNPKNPLHDDFEWDDSVAAEAFRSQQANALIRHFDIVYRDVKVEKRTFDIIIPKYTTDPNQQKTGGYRETTDLLTPFHRKDTLTQEHGRALGHVKRFANYLRAAGLMAVASALEGAMCDALSAIDGLPKADAGA